MPRMKIPKKLKPFITTPKRFKVAYGGRGSGKSMSFGDCLLKDVQTRGIKVACFREFQNSIDDSVHSLLSSEIERLELQGFEVQQNQILYNGEKAFNFRGLARNPDGIRSMHGFDRFWIEEGQSISTQSLRALTPTLRTAGSEIWISANPGSSADPFSQRFIKPFERELIKNGYYEDDLHLIIKINHMDNPFFPDVLEQDRLYDKQHLSTAEYNHIWLGDYNDEVDGSIISVDLFNAAIDAHVKLGFKPLGAKIASFDVSDEHGDPKGFALRQGSVILDACDYDKGDVNDGCDWAINRALDHQADYFTWDCDGMGISLKRQINEAFHGTKIETVMFKGSEGVEAPEQIYQAHQVDHRYRGKTNKEVFRNKRSQYWWKLRDRFQNTYRAVTKGEYVDPDEMISLSSDIEDMDALRAEICRIPLKKNNSGLIQIMTKNEMLKLKIASPNMGDSVMQSMMTPKIIKDFEHPIVFESFW